jgi:serine/threonine protein kinase
MSVPEALRCAVPLAEALRQLHERGSLFGSLEPAKVVVGDSGVQLVLREAGNGGEVANGISPYMSPEQIAGKPQDVRSDIFAFGALLYEMVSGHRAFDGQTPAEIGTAILERDPAPLTAVPPDLARLVARCLAKQPEDRWQRMQKVLLELKLIKVQIRSAAPEKDRLETILQARIADLERNLAAQPAEHAALRQEMATLEARLAARVEGCEAHSDLTDQSLSAVQASVSLLDQQGKAQARSIGSLEAAVAQTDDLIERVVDSVDALQEFVAERYESRGLAATQSPH